MDSTENFKSYAHLIFLFLITRTSLLAWLLFKLSLLSVSPLQGHKCTSNTQVPSFPHHCASVHSLRQRGHEHTQTNTTSDRTNQLRWRHHLVFIKWVCRSLFVCVRASAHLSKHAAFKCTSMRVSDLLLARHQPPKWDQQMGFIGV